MVNAGVKRYRDLNGRHLTVVGQAEVDHEAGHQEQDERQQGEHDRDRALLVAVCAPAPPGRRQHG